MRGQKGQGRAVKQADHWFTFQRGLGVTGWQVECVLKRYGVPVVNRRYGAKDPTVAVCVPGNQAKFAEYLLCRAGLAAALVTPLLNPKHAQTKVGAMPPAWGKPARTYGVMGWIVRLLGMAVAGDTAKGMKTASTKGKR